MDSEEFSAMLQHRVISLHAAEDVVRLSFIVQHSVSYLDLNLCQYSIDARTLCDCCALRRLRDLNTEEKCRKFFTASRSLLYTLHLDLPKGRECSLRDDPESDFVQSRCDPTIPHIAKITPRCGLDCWMLCNAIEDALLANVPKLKILRWILKIHFFQVPLLRRLEIETVHKFIDCFYPKITDYALFKDFINQFDIIEWMTTYESPEILEYFLYYARHHGNLNIEEDIFSIDETIGHCIYFELFLNIGPIFKFIHTPKINLDDSRMYVAKISKRRPELNEEVLDNAEKWMKKERVHYMLQIICMYILRNQHRCTGGAASEVLRLVWSSIPDAYITLTELEAVFSKVLSNEEMNDIYVFYARAVGEFHDCIEPRSLQQSCKIVVRRILRERKCWIPQGISKTGLPKPLQSFLNLQ